MSPICYKVLAPNLRSLGMKPKGKAVPIIQYYLNQWIRPQEPISRDADKGGGLWVTPTISQAKALARYLWKRYRRRVRIFRCKIGRILCQPSTYRIKTDKVKIFEEIMIT